MATAANNSPSWYLFVYLLSSSALILSCCCEVSDLLLGGYGPIRSNEDRSAVAAAKFAVSEHNNKLHDHDDDDATNKTSLEFVRIVDGSQQIVAGVNYKLVILAKDGSSSYNYYGVYLYDGCWKKFKTLYFFNRIMASVPDGRWWWLPQNLVMGWFEPKAPPLATFVGAYVPIDNRQDPTVVAAAKFAVAEWAKTSKKSTSLEFVRVVDGEARVDENINYKLVILAKDNINGSITYEYYEAVINVDRHFFLHHALGEFRTLESFNPIRSVPDQDISGARTLSSF